MLNTVIAIDGPAASGKSTVARKLANKIRYVYVDTGAMYRTFAWLASQHKLDPTSRPEVKKLIQSTQFETKISDGAVKLSANGHDVAGYLRLPEVQRIVSPISTIPELREFLVNRQRQLRLEAPLVMEGRDIGTVVIPDTIYKFFLDADPEVRTQRRHQEGHADSVLNRDAIDKSRAAAPLIRAADAEEIDTTDMSAEEVVEVIYESIKERGLSV